MGSLIGKAAEGIAAGIGLASEAHKAHKAKKTARNDMPTNDTGDGSSADSKSLETASEDKVAYEDDNEAVWELDEAQDELVGGDAPKEKKPRSLDEIIKAFLQRYPPPPPSYEATIQDTEAGEAAVPVSRPKIEYPVVLPQRRPKDKTRGFVRAYAPDLAEVGIDQAMFLDFLETFNQASLANPLINAINLASFATMALPTGIGIAVSIAVQIATQIAEVQSRHRSNKFLDKINDEFFRPRGLYCLVMTYDPNSVDPQIQVNITSTISGNMANKDRTSHKFQYSSGTTGEFEFPPTAAPLVFPGLDYIALQSNDDEEAKKMKNRLKRGKLFVDNYMDRRAQAKFAGKSPDSVLAAGPTATFSSRFADPNHPVNSGSLFSLVSLGHFNPPPLGGGGLGGRLSRGRRDGYGGYVLDSRSGRPMGGGLNDRLSMSYGGFGGRSRMDMYNGNDRYGYGYGRDLLGRGRGGSPLGGGLFGLVDAVSDAVRNRGNQRGQDASYDQTGPDPRYQRDQYGQNTPYNQHGQNMQHAQNPRNGPGRGLGSGGLLGPGWSMQEAGPLGIKKILNKKVLYLMIVNMPTDEEMVEAHDIAAQVQAHVNGQA